MKDRSELFPIFKSYCAEVQNQFGVSICKFRSDNALEYMSSPFQQFMTDQGIIHQTFCPYTPQQNGVAKRKNRNLIETPHTHSIPCSAVFFWRCSSRILLFN